MLDRSNDDMTHRHIESKVVSSPHVLFDPHWYAQQNPDLPPERATFGHYLTEGWRNLKSPHPLFSVEYYFEQRPDVKAAGLEPLTHFITQGWKEGVNPHPQFQTRIYLKKNPDAASIGVNPLVHYILRGNDDDRVVPTPQIRRHVDPLRYTYDPAIYDIPRDCFEAVVRQFDEVHYLQQQPDLQGLQALAHFWTIGWREGYDPNPEFSSSNYLEHNSDVRDSGQNPFWHFINWGRAEGRSPNPSSSNIDRGVLDLISSSVDAEFYLKQHPNLGRFSPAEHFVLEGSRRGYDPNSWFSTADYLRLNVDVKIARMNPLYHYLRWGLAEGRTPKIKKAPRLAASDDLAPILFVGHDGIQAGAQVVLLEIIRWYAEHTRRRISLLLLDVGHLTSSYSEYADVYVLHNNLDDVIDSDDFQKFIDQSFAFAYVNTIASGAFSEIFDRYLKPRGVPLLLHVHELSAVIREFESSFVRLRTRASSFIAVSEMVRHCLVKEFGVDDGRVFLANAFIRVIAPKPEDVLHLRESARRILGLAPNDYVVMGCGTVYWRKGPDLFFESALKALASAKNLNLKFVWIGDGDDLDDLRARCLEHGLESTVHFIGFHANARELLAAGDVFFLASREDPFPLVCMEAAQFGSPIIYFLGATGIAEFVSGDAGVGIPAFDTGAAAKEIVSFGVDGDRRKECGSIARERVLTLYYSDIIINRIAQHVHHVANYIPDISVIVPAYNLELYIAERIDSIIQQSLQDFEIIVLDNCSTDRTVEIVERYLGNERVRLIKNSVNSGTPFKQWKLGSELARSEIVWIAEGDDSASSNFLEVLAPSFLDPQVALAFCPSIIMDSEGNQKPGALDPYYSLSTFPFEDLEVVREGFAAVEDGFGAMCLIVNASSAIMRKSLIKEGIRIASDDYRMAGDWIAYLYALRNGKLYYSRGTENYFRRHENSMVHKTEGTETYFDERFRIASFVSKNFHLSRKRFRQFLALNENEWHRFRQRIPHLPKGAVLRHDELIAARKSTWPVRQMRIGFYVHGMLFSKGGIERLAATLANALSRRGHSVWIFCRVWGRKDPIYAVNDEVTIVPIFDESDLSNSISRLRLEVARYDLDCFVPMLSEWLFDPIVESAQGLEIPIIVSEHNDPWKIEECWWNKEARRSCFEKASAIHFLLGRFKRSLPDYLTSKIEIIPNGVEISDIHLLVGITHRPKRFLGVGRLAPQKRFDRLINAFALIEDQIPEWRLDIFGEGEERSELQALIDAKRLGDRICLCGETNTVLDEMTKSGIFVIPSAFEGFGIVVIEAKMAGLPCIAYANCNGPNELIRDDVDGKLVSSVDEIVTLAAAMLQLADDENERLRLAARARENIYQFDIRSVALQWERLIGNCVSGLDMNGTSL